jgi:hypothetical protein
MPAPAAPSLWTPADVHAKAKGCVHVLVRLLTPPTAASTTTGPANAPHPFAAPQSPRLIASSQGQDIRDGVEMLLKNDLEKIGDGGGQKVLCRALYGALYSVCCLRCCLSTVYGAVYSSAVTCKSQHQSHAATLSLRVAVFCVERRLTNSYPYPSPLACTLHLAWPLTGGCGPTSEARARCSEQRST